MADTPDPTPMPTPTPATEADDRAVDASRPHVVIISGLSGAGKTSVSKLLEDVGYTVVDNLPLELLGRLAEMVLQDPGRFERLALVVDARSGDPEMTFAAASGALKGRGIEPQVFFLEARDDVLIRRFSETRHRHPLQSEHGVAASIQRERELLEEIRARADVIVDTSEMSSRQLRERIYSALGTGSAQDQMALHIVTFGYKHGIPLEADLVFDVRFMENPFYVDRLRSQSGLTEPVRRFVLDQPVTQRFLDHVDRFLHDFVPAYQSEGKQRLTMGIGCTGGYHRSVAIAQEIAERWRAYNRGPVSIWHRELDRA
ncbi:MAG TPA: RNase adapter RapZ [Candidatus Limnocylindrales bacterium]|nr:RNase adapter RapZ [Candidatus Limnocylindrales bacterium]